MLNIEKKNLMVSLPLISLFVCIFPSWAAYSLVQNETKEYANLICQNTYQSDEDDQEQKLRAKAARDSQINSLLDQAISLYKEKQLPEAIDLFNQVIRLAPDNAAAHFSLGIALEASKDLAGAADHYQIAHKLEPQNSEYEKAATSAKKKLDEQNIAQFEKSKKELLAKQAAEAFKQGQYDQSLSLYLELEKQDPHLAFAKYNIGTIYLIQKKADEALTYYKAAHKLEPDNKQYDESLQKLKLSIKEADDAKKQTQLSNHSNDKEKNNKNKSKQSYLAFCGLRVKSGKEGVLIEALLTGSRAAEAGLRPGDIIQVIDGRSIKKESQLEEMLQSKPYGQKFQLLVKRGDQMGQILF